MLFVWQHKLVLVSCAQSAVFHSAKSLKRCLNSDRNVSMSLAEQVLAVNDDLPIRTYQPVHSGKVRSVYWLTEQDSR
ncbi:TPA: phosphoribosylaminoimidazolesuccinocarboxamide synthase, partial [Vibrio cholerae]